MASDGAPSGMDSGMLQASGAIKGSSSLGANAMTGAAAGGDRIGKNMDETLAPYVSGNLDLGLSGNLNDGPMKLGAAIEANPFVDFFDGVNSPAGISHQTFDASKTGFGDISLGEATSFASNLNAKKMPVIHSGMGGAAHGG